VKLALVQSIYKQERLMGRRDRMKYTLIECLQLEMHNMEGSLLPISDICHLLAT
jgi:hypothetical protein